MEWGSKAVKAIEEAVFIHMEVTGVDGPVAFPVLLGRRLRDSLEVINQTTWNRERRT